jgi:hypothetical protein
MALSAGVDQNKTTSRILNKLHYAMAEVAEDIGTATASDIVLMFDASDDYKPKYGDATNVLEVARAAEQASRIVTTTATALNLTITEHAEKVVLINTNSSGAATFTLPAATGSGAKFELVNAIAQTQGSIVIAANGTDVIKGRALAFDSTAVATHQSFFVTSATSDKITWNRTTSGGVGQDRAVLYDEAANTWRVFVENNCTGGPTTPFSATT